MKKLLLILILSVSFVLAEDKFDAVKMKGVKIALLSELDSVAPGDKFTVAIHIQHFDGFHTYWKNPGMVGFATQVKWKLPVGFKAGDLQWQVPEKAKMLKYNCHGYNGETFLLTEIQAPEKVPDKLTISANVGGMSCSEKSCCSIGFADTSLEIKGGKQVVNKNHRQLILKAKDRLPKKMPEWKESLSVTKDYMVLSIKGDLKGINKDKVYFYPDQNIYDTESKQEVTLKGNELKIKFKLNAYVPEDLKKVTGLVFTSEEWGKSKRQYLPVECQVN